MIKQLKHFSGTIIWVAPFFNRSGYGVLARSTVSALHRHGLRVRIMSVDGTEPGVDDMDMELIKSLQKTTVVPPITLIISHVPSKSWLQLKFPEPNLRIMSTTYDGCDYDNLPPAEWMAVYEQMDQIWLQSLKEREVYISTGIPPEKVHIIHYPEAWKENSILPPITIDNTENKPFRFLSIAMFQPRRRWDALIKAYLEEFKHEPNVELYLKVNYPSWHPVPGKPQKDLYDMITGLRLETGSDVPIIIDDDLGTRRGILDLIDSCNVYVSTDTVSTGPVTEARVRHRLVVVPSEIKMMPKEYYIGIDSDPEYKTLLTQEMLIYQPHHRNAWLPLLKIDDVRKALRDAFSLTSEERFKMCRGAVKGIPGPKETLPRMFEVLNSAWKTKLSSKSNPQLENQLNFDSKEAISIIWQGSQFIYHSLALINRELCLKLIDKGHDLSIIPYEKHSFSHKVDDRFQKLSARFNKKLKKPADVHVRHQWPPNFTPPQEGHWVIIQPWEFGSLPKDWIGPMNKNVDEMWVPSSFVRECYIKSGISADRVFVVPNGVDTLKFNPNAEPFCLKSQKCFKFLFVGGTIYRKGIDILLEAYCNAFTAKNDVCLVIKDMGGQSFYKGQTAKQMIAEIQKKDDSPEIEYLEQMMGESDLAGLYTACNCLVHPYRGEGFGLPVAEAMACGLPVVVTKGGACDDFCLEENAYFIDSSVKPVNIPDYQLAKQGWLLEPDHLQLQKILRHVCENKNEARLKGKKGTDSIKRNFTWKNAANIVVERLRALKDKPIIRYQSRKKAGLIQTNKIHENQVGKLSDVKTSESMQDSIKNDHLWQPNESMYKNIQAMVSKGMDKEAIMALGKLLESYPDFAIAHNDLGVLYYKDGKKGEALDHYQKAAELQPENINFQKNLADFYYVELDRVKDAMEIYVKILTLNPRDIECLLMLGHISVSMEKFDDAKVFYVKVLEADPDNADARQNLDALQKYEQGAAI